MVGMFGIVFANLAGGFNTTNLPAPSYNFRGHYEFMNIEPGKSPENTNKMGCSHELALYCRSVVL
jgi:hypothetical protein